MPTGSQDIEFSGVMEGHATISVDRSALDEAIEWIAANLDPEDVFPTKDLEAWADNNGYSKE